LRFVSALLLRFGLCAGGRGAWFNFG
jgi:hypothetical protein